MEELALLSYKDYREMIFFFFADHLKLQFKLGPG